jgi:hypothetical protein
MEEKDTQFRVTSTVTMELEEYERLKGKLTEEVEKNAKMSGTLERWSEFLRRLDGDPNVIQMYTTALDDSKKIGTAFFDAFNEFVKRSKLDLKEDI